LAKINSNYEKLAAGYLFPEISRRVKAFSEKNPPIEIVRLGIGNTTEPLSPKIIEAMHESVNKLSNVKTYTGYGDEQGNTNLRKAIVEYYKKLGATIEPDEVFVSDGAKCDVSNIQSIFLQNTIIAVQDPAYPVYVDSNVIAGRSKNAKEGVYEGIVYMKCTEKNNFFPQLPEQKVDLIYICSPNNPTGAVATKEQLKKFVDYARKNKAVIIFDSAYNEFISEDLPKTIYTIEGAKECAIEINSFSKMAGFTGVRLGWSIVPKECICEDAQKGKLNSMWNRRQTTMFNGASNVAQDGGVGALSEEGMKECKQIIQYYMTNAQIIKKGLEEKGLKVVCGGVNAPYLWVKTPNNMKAWDFFDKMLTEANVVITPGSGFGPSGEGYFRVSAFGHRENIEKAIQKIKNNLKL
jgi:LL-diaminopimelate aminotransferase